MLKIRIRYLLWLKEKLGKEYEYIELSDNSNIKDLIDYLCKKYGFLRELFSEDTDTRGLIILVNGKPVKNDQRLGNNDEVVILPPVSGG